MQNDPDLLPVVCATGQHRELLEDALASFGICPDHNLRIMSESQTPQEVTARVLAGLASLLPEIDPACTLVHGDTCTTLGAALAAFYAKVPVGHVEAGLRSGHLGNPFPEEGNRILTDQITDYCYVPTASARANLLREGIADERIVTTGNTAVDALLITRDRVVNQPAEYWRAKFGAIHRELFSEHDRLILITAHRRENFGAPLADICRAIRQLAEHHPDWHFLYPVHPNPNVTKPVGEMLRGLRNVHLVAPLEYEPFIYCMDRSYLILTDSGGLQEEAPSLGKPVIVLREKTERWEGVEAGSAVLAGTRCDDIVRIVQELANDAERYRAMTSASNPYGDGRAARRIVEHLRGVTANSRVMMSRVVERAGE
jgi:UDP-N-acetylglucosamine 2-epimerase (non-hydrolysing)